MKPEALGLPSGKLVRQYRNPCFKFLLKKYFVFVSVEPVDTAGIRYQLEWLAVRHHR